MTDNSSSRLSTDTASQREKPFEGPGARILLVIGAGVTGFGVLGLFHSASRTHPGQWIRWWLGSLIVHDLILAPIVFALAVLVVSRVPAPCRGPIQGGLVASGFVLLVAFPFLRGYGRTPDNPSILPNNYGHGVLITLAVIWAVVGLVLLRRHKDSRKPDDSRIEM